MLSKKYKPVIAVAISILTMMALSACGDGILGGGGAKVYDEDGNQVITPFAEINPNRAGLYVPIGGDKAIVPLPMAMNETAKDMVGGSAGLDSSLTESSAADITMKWAAAAGASKEGKSLDMAKYIPVVDYEKRPIFAVLPTEDDINTAVWATPFRLQGYSFGAPLYVSGDERSLYIDTQNIVGGSTMEGALKANGLYGQKTRIVSINGEKALPISSVDIETGFMKGLQKNGLYELKVYKGTKTVVMGVLADTIIFEQDTEANPVGLKYTATESGYYYLNTSGIDKGRYYLIEPFGSMVKTYGGENWSAGGQGTK